MNLVAIGCFHRHLLHLHDAAFAATKNHPVLLAFTSKFNSLCRMSFDREIAALEAIGRIELGEQVEYEVIPLK